MAGLPKAVSPTVKTPGFYLLLNLLAGGASSSSAALRILIMAPKSSAGTITADTQLEQDVAGESAVSTLLGVGTPGHLAAKRIFAAFGRAKVDVVSPAASAGASATGTLTFTGTVTAAMTMKVTIKGVEIYSPWLVGESVTVAAATLVGKINQKTSDLPLTASNVAGVVTLTPKIPGPWANDITLFVDIYEGTGGVLTASGANLTGGTTEPDFTNALDLVKDREYAYIVPCVSNADAQSASASSNPGRIKTHIDTYDEGMQAKLQQAIVGLTGSLSSAKTGAIGRNYGPMQYVFCLAGQSLGCEFAGYEAGRRALLEVDDPTVNRVGEVLPTALFGPRDVVGDKPTAIEVEDGLSNGLSIINITQSGNLFLVQPITTYSQDAQGAPDARLFGVEGVSGTYAFARDLRATVPVEFDGAKIVQDLSPEDEDPPKGVTERRDVEAFVLSRADVFVKRGVVRGDKLNEAIANKDIYVEIDGLDESQVNIVFPVWIVKPLTKFSAVIQRKG